MNESTDQSTRGARELPSPFSQLVIMIATSALQQLGQMPGPDGGRPDVQLEGAQGLIDILEMLSDKTQGNLDDAEGKMLKDTLTMLRLQYVEARNAMSSQKETPPSEPRDAPRDDSAPPPPPDEDRESKTRYRKSYG